MIEAIDLFCGAGGLTRGLLNAGIAVRAGFDIDPKCRHAYEANNAGSRFHLRNVAEVTAKELQKIWSPKAIRLLAGCAPCQPFSSAAKSAKDSNTHADPRYPLLDHFTRLVKGCLPEFVTMENVPRVQSHKPFKDFVQTLQDLGYCVWFKSVACVDFGIPQTRRRMVLTATRMKDSPVILIPIQGAPSTVEQTIGTLPPLNAGQADSSDRIHKARTLSPLNLERIRSSKEGGNWKDWPISLRSGCHIRDSGSTYKNVYARMSATSPAPTMTTQFFNFGTGRFGHPTQDRAISPREAALLQSFPLGYQFVAPDAPAEFASLGRMIGNAVPPKLGEAIGNAFQNHLSRIRIK